jgi:hypothetical protein
MPLTALEHRFASLEETNKNLAAEVHALTALITEVQGLREAEEHNRRRLRNVALGLTLAIALAALVVFGATLARVNTLLDTQATQTRGLCQSRNAASEAMRMRFAQLATETKDASERAVYLTLSREQAGAGVDCNRLK